MRIFVMKLTLRATWVHSLKEKRMIVRSITKKMSNTFNISVSESECQDVHQTIVIGVAGIAATDALADSAMESILTFVEENTDAELVDVAQQVEVYHL